MIPFFTIRIKRRLKTTLGKLCEPSDASRVAFVLSLRLYRATNVPQGRSNNTLQNTRRAEWFAVDRVASLSKIIVRYLCNLYRIDPLCRGTCGRTRGSQWNGASWARHELEKAYCGKWRVSCRFRCRIRLVHAWPCGAHTVALIYGSFGQIFDNQTMAAVSRIAKRSSVLWLWLQLRIFVLITSCLVSTPTC